MLTSIGLLALVEMQVILEDRAHFLPPLHTLIAPDGRVHMKVSVLVPSRLKTTT